MSLFAAGLCMLALAVIVPSRASAAVMCRCAYRPLESTVCENDLTARITVLWKQRTKSAEFYVAEVRRVFQGDVERWDLIEIEVPANCGHELRVGRSYAVSLNVNEETGRYSTFACSTYVREWRDLEDSERETLNAPVCDAPVLAGEGEICYRHIESDATQSVDVACDAGLACVSRSTSFGFNSVRYCEAAPVLASEGEICYRHIESDASQSVDIACGEGLKCVNKSTLFGFNSVHYCEAESWCGSNETAESDCANVPHIMVVGAWSCEQNSCAWKMH